MHKELDADDGELTRTKKVRRTLINAKYATLVDALYSGQSNCFVTTEVSFEDGVAEMLTHLDDWKDAPVWEPDSIKQATAAWFEYLN